VDLQNSPDGMDPDPLTIPKVVECGNCGWPVYPRDSKVATKKTFERAGIVRGSRKDEAGTVGLQDDDDEDAASQDSRNTEEKLRDELEDLQELCEELKKENSDLKEDKERLEAQVKELEATIEEQFDRIRFVEEAEQKWRDKLDLAELRIEELIQYLERSGMVSADRERGLIMALEEIAMLRETLATFNRRRALMLMALEQKLKRREQEDNLAICLRLWRTRAVDDKLTREAEDIEDSRQRDVGAMNLQISVERARVASLKAAEVQLKGRLRAAGQRLLMRALSDSSQPAAKAHALRVWNGTTPLLATERVLEATQKTLGETKSELEDLYEQTEEMRANYGKVSAERDELDVKVKELLEQIEFLQLEGAGQQKGKRGDLEARKNAKRKQEEEMRRALEQALAELERERRMRVEEKADLQQTLEALETRLEVAEAAALHGGGNTVPEIDEASRIVPKGQGVLCCGCLKQLVHRGVRPLPPVDKLGSKAADRLEKAKDMFFEQELRGAPAVDDAVHTYQWRARKDPYGIARLTVWPRRSPAKGMDDSAGSRAGSRSPSPQGGSESALPPPPPTTGLPALKRSKKLRSEGVASPLRRTMRDFKPSFR